MGRNVDTIIITFSLKLSLNYDDGKPVCQIIMLAENAPMSGGAARYILIP